MDKENEQLSSAKTSAVHDINAIQEDTPQDQGLTQPPTYKPLIQPKEALKKELAQEGILFAQGAAAGKIPASALEGKTVIRAEDIAFRVYGKTEYEVKQKLDLLCKKIATQKERDVELGLAALYLFLNKLQTDLPKNEWLNLIKEVILKHPITHIIYLDPCTKRSFEKPKGYPGDAALLDYFYKINTLCSDNLGKKLLEKTINRPAAEAVRNRAELIANYIDKVALKIYKPRILSIACGHLREASLSKAIINNKIGELVAVDHDLDTLEVIKQGLTTYNITTIQNSILNLIKGQKKNKLGKFDLVYSAGLFDYLSERMGQALTKYMFNMLNPGGTLLITNFIPNIPDKGYMEAFMDWKLIYREIPQIELLARNLQFKNIQEKRIFRNENNNILYLEISKIK